MVFFRKARLSLTSDVRNEAQTKKLRCLLYHRENELTASITTTEDQTREANSFPSASLCVVFCFHGEESSTEGEMETEEKENPPFLRSPLRRAYSGVNASVFASFPDIACENQAKPLCSMVK